MQRGLLLPHLIGNTSLSQQPQGRLGQRQILAPINPVDLCRRNCTGSCSEAPKAPTFLHLPTHHHKLCAGRSFVASLPQNVAVMQPWCSSELLGLEGVIGTAAQERGQGTFPQGPASSTAHPTQHQRPRSTWDCQAVPSSSRATASQHLATTDKQLPQGLRPSHTQTVTQPTLNICLI